MREVENINSALDALSAGKLKKSFNFLFDVISSHPEWGIKDRYDDLVNNYNIMLDYMARGYKDERRQNIYDKLQSDVNLFIQSIQHQRRLSISLDYRNAVNSKLDVNISFGQIRQSMESYVSDMALLSLEVDENVRKQRQIQLSSIHYRKMEQLFNRIWTFSVWNEETVTELSDLILASTIDSIDAQLIISAVMLAGLEFFDYHKLLVLATVYQRTSDVYLRERALVGWIFVCQSRTYNSEAITSLVQQLLDDNKTAHELFDLQKQIVFCKNAEKDHDIIQKEIMPDLINNNNLRVTRFGIEEKETDAMQDILHPDAEEQAMENLEKSMERIVSMQQSGADVYFGGFSMMKNFPFFRTMSNWFCPFGLDHPGLADVVQNVDAYTLLQTIIDSGPFCDSDKYSFCLAMVNVIENIPSSVKEMLKTHSAGLGLTGPLDNEKNSSAYVRRTYLQNLYRFYKLYMNRTEMKNPFDLDPCSLDDVFWKDNLIDHYNALAVFFNKMHLSSYSLRLLQLYPEEMHDFNYHMIRGAVSGFYEDYRYAVEIKPDDEKALSSYADSLEMAGQYVEGELIYRRVNELYPNPRYETGFCCCLIELGKYDEALKVLYKLDFEKPNYMKAKRALAWALFCTGKLSQAEKYYEHILEQHKILMSDYLNAGHVALAMGEMKRAIERYSFYSKKHRERWGMCQDILEKAISVDKKFLKMNGVSDADIQLMVDIVDAENP